MDTHIHIQFLKYEDFTINAVHELILFLNTISWDLSMSGPMNAYMIFILWLHSPLLYRSNDLFYHATIDDWRLFQYFATAKNTTYEKFAHEQIFLWDRLLNV